MNIHKLSNEDMKMLNNLIELNTSIEYIYKSMYLYEIDLQNNSISYQKAIQSLKYVVDVENKMYNDKYFTYEKCIDLAYYVYKNQLSNNNISDTESILTLNHDEKVFRRILYTLINRIINNSYVIKNILTKELFDLMSLLKVENPNESMDKVINNNIELQKALEKDVLNGFLVFLQEYINSEKSNEVKKQLISTKYYASFINKSIEEDLIYNRFNIHDTFYTKSRLIADLTNTDLEVYYLLKNIYGQDIAVKQISELLEMSDKEYDNIRCKTSSILRQCLMKSSLLLMNDESICDINYDFHEFVESDNYLNKYPNDNISKEIIIKCFKSIKKDRTKPYILSLK